MSGSNLPVPAHFVGTGLTRIDRTVGREVAKVKGWAAVIAARETAKIDAVEAVTERAQIAVARVSAMEQLLVNGSPPLASDRIRAVGDAGCMVMTHVVMSMAQQLR